MNKNVDIVQAQLEAYNEFDLEKFCSYYHQDIIVKSLLDDKTCIQGMNNFRIAYERLFKTHPNQKCILKSRMVTSEAIIDEEFITGRSNYPDGLHSVAIYEIKDNLISRVWFI